MGVLLTVVSNCSMPNVIVVYLSDFVPRLSVFPANLHYIIDTLCRYPSGYFLQFVFIVSQYRRN